MEPNPMPRTLQVLSKMYPGEIPGASASGPYSGEETKALRSQVMKQEHEHTGPQTPHPWFFPFPLLRPDSPLVQRMH